MKELQQDEVVLVSGGTTPEEVGHAIGHAIGVFWGYVQALGESMVMDV
ncbi:MAG: hypothetical protein ACOY3E_15035 [Pseudomonadota bacterium]